MRFLLQALWGLATYGTSLEAQTAGVRYSVSDSHGNHNQLGINPTGHIVIAGFEVHPVGSIAYSGSKADATVYTEGVRRRAFNCLVRGYESVFTGESPPEPHWRTCNTCPCYNLL